MKAANPITTSDNDALHLLGRIEAAFQKAGISTRYRSVGEIIATDEDSQIFRCMILSDAGMVFIEGYIQTIPGSVTALRFFL